MEWLSNINWDVMKNYMSEGIRPYYYWQHCWPICFVLVFYDFLCVIFNNQVKRYW